MGRKGRFVFFLAFAVAISMAAAAGQRGHAQTFEPHCTSVPDHKKGVYDFGAACANHDECYDTPRSVQATCDSRFLADMQASCRRMHGNPPPNALEKALSKECFAAARSYYIGVRTLGAYNWNKTQLELITSVSLASAQGGVVAVVRPAYSAVQLQWSVTQSDGSSNSGTSTTNAQGRITIPVSGNASVTGTAEAQVVAFGQARAVKFLRGDLRGTGAHARSDYCLNPGGAVVVKGRCSADFSGTWSGNYSGRIYGKEGCNDFPIDGATTLSLSQQGTAVSGTITLVGSALRWNAACLITSRSNEDIPFSGTVSGKTASGGGISLTMNADLVSLSGSLQGSGGQVTFTARRG